MSVPEIFDRAARRLRRDRGQPRTSFLDEAIAERLLDRLDSVTRRFERVALVGANAPLAAGLAARGVAPFVLDPAPRRAAALKGKVAEEDALPLAPGALDLVVAAGTLDTVADLPGALILMRRALAPDGLLLGMMVGAPSLPLLRRLVAVADGITGGAAVQRFHPLVDARAAGELLVRAGFALPVADAETVTLAYSSLDRLLADLREAGATNVLPRRRPVDRAWWAALHAAFAEELSRGTAQEEVTLVTLTGWTPAPTQPRPARRGSGRVPLARALNPPGG